MKIFEKRPLSLILCIILCGFSLFSFVDLIFKIVCYSLALILFAISFVIPYIKKNILLKICIISFLISGLLSQIYFGIFYYPEQNDTESTIEATVITVTENENFNKIEATIDKIDNDKTFKHKVLIYDYLKNEYIISGDKIKLTSKMQVLSRDDDARSYEIGQGISAIIFCSSDIDKISVGQKHIKAYFSDYRAKITDYATKLSGKDASGLLSALLMGDRSFMSPELEVNFKNTGITHILALSGTHLTLLCGAISWLLTIFRVDKRLKIILSSIFCIAFMFLTGLPSTILRAGLMFLISAILQLFIGCKDSLTNLFISITVIITIQPYSVYDIGLWLSAIATLGLLLAIDMFENRYDESPWYIKASKGLIHSIYYSLFAISATILICVFVFEGISWLAIITTIVFGFMTQIYLYVGCFILIFGTVLPFITVILDPLYQLVFNTSDFFADLPFSYTSTGFISVKIFAIILTILIITFTVFSIKYKKIFVGIMMGMLIGVYLSSVISTVVYTYNDQIIYSSESGDRFLITSNGKTTLIENSDFSLDDFYETKCFLNENKFCSVDNYVLLNYSYSLNGKTNDIITKILPKKIYLPTPIDSQEANLFNETYEILKKHEIDIIFYDRNETFMIGNINFMSFDRNQVSNSNKTCATIITLNNKSYGYLSRGALDHIYNANEILDLSEVIIFGGYGTKYDDYAYIESLSDQVNKIIVADDRIIFDNIIFNTDQKIVRYTSDIPLID